MAKQAGCSSPNDLDRWSAAAEQIGQIDRAGCRVLVENRYTLLRYGAALADRLRALAAGTMDSTGANA